jgi:hypothetical protein
MRMMLFAVALTAAPIAATPVLAEPPAPTAAEGGQHVTVDGDRRICRSVRRTSSRMGQGRICRTQSQWAANGVSISSHRDIDGAQNALDMYGEKVSTNCTGATLSRDYPTPLGPR